MRKRGKKAELRFCSKEKLRNPDIFLPVLIFFGSYFIKCTLFTRFAFTYDELAYSATARDLARNGGWFDFSNSGDLFFFPPLFNWLSGVLIIFGVERLLAVRTVTMIFSSAVPVVIYFILRNYGLSVRRALTGPLLWIMMPGVLFYGTVGQVEIPFLFFVLLSILLIQKRAKYPKYNSFFLFSIRRGMGKGNSLWFCTRTISGSCNGKRQKETYNMDWFFHSFLPAPVPKIFLFRWLRTFL